MPPAFSPPKTVDRLLYGMPEQECELARPIVYALPNRWEYLKSTILELGAGAQVSAEKKQC